MAIKAIQTNYKGCHFRSRLEARWAVFFDALGLQWEYEPAGFDLGDGVCYLPDFRVMMPFYDDGYAEAWFEVKGIDGRDLEREVFLMDGAFKVFRFATTRIIEEGKPSFVFVLGNIPLMTFDGNEPCGVCVYNTDNTGRKSNGIYSSPFNPFSVLEDMGMNISEASVAARSARFEHGETPK